MDKMVMNGRGCSTRCWLPRPGGGFLPCHGLPISPHSSVEESAAGLSLLLAFHPSLGDSLLGHVPHKLAPRQGGVLQLKQQDSTPPFGSYPRKGGAPAPRSSFFLWVEKWDWEGKGNGGGPELCLFKCNRRPKAIRSLGPFPTWRHRVREVTR